MLRNEIDWATSLCQTLDSTKTHESLLVNHLRSNGFDSEAVMPEAAKSLLSLGLVDNEVVNPFAEMLASLEMHRDGMLTTPELILALQCSTKQKSNLIRHQALPAKIAEKISIVDWEDIF